MRVALRNQAPRIRYAWTSYLATLLIISGFLTSAAAVAMFSLGGPLPAIVGSSSDATDLDEREQFPQLPSSTPMDSVAISQELKPLTVRGRHPLNADGLANSHCRQALTARDAPEADDKGYLFATARHVVDTGKSGETKQAMVATNSGGLEPGGRCRPAQESRSRSAVDTRGIPAADHSPSPSTKEKMASRYYVIGHPEGSEVHAVQWNHLAARRRHGADFSAGKPGQQRRSRSMTRTET